jgi:D-glycero-alpha-D-manno-heptose 1-phosphate guanylyltransferase
MIRKAIILAGGFGTRLQSVVSDMPKPMAPIQDHPFLALLISFLKSNGIEEIILSVGYLNEKISDYFKDSYLDIKITYKIENTPLGTGGAFKFALNDTSEDIVVLNGDTFFNLDIQAFYSFHKAHQSDFSIALKPLAKSDRYGTVIIENNIIKGFKEKGNYENVVINAGCYITNKACLDKFDLPISFSLEKDFLETHTHDLIICGYISDNYFIDIGIPSDYLEAQKSLQNYIKNEHF